MVRGGAQKHALPQESTTAMSEGKLSPIFELSFCAKKGAQRGVKHALQRESRKAMSASLRFLVSKVLIKWKVGAPSRGGA